MVFLLLVHVCLCVTCAGTSRYKAPSARSRLSWLPATLAGAEENISASIVMKPSLLPLPLRRLLMLTANNVLLDECALLEPERRQRLMKRERMWSRNTDRTLPVQLSLSRVLPDDDLTHTHTHRHTIVLFPLFFSVPSFLPSLSCLSVSRGRWHEEEEEVEEGFPLCFHRASLPVQLTYTCVRRIHPADVREAVNWKTCLKCWSGPSPVEGCLCCSLFCWAPLHRENFSAGSCWRGLRGGGGEEFEYWESLVQSGGYCGSMTLTFGDGGEKH